MKTIWKYRLLGAAMGLAWSAIFAVGCVAVIVYVPAWDLSGPFYRAVLGVHKEASR